MNQSHRLRVFLCHASQDKSIIRELYQRLANESWIDPWLDEEKLLPGQDWDLEIEKAVEAADVVLVCLSSRSVSKEGYVQRELKFVLDIALEKPDGTIFVIPLRLDECLVPRRLRTWQYVDYFPLDQRRKAYQRLTQSLRARHSQLASNEENQQSDPVVAVEPSSPIAEKKVTIREIAPNENVLSLPMANIGILDLAGSLLPILFFAQVAPIMLGEYTDASWILLGITAVLNALFLVFKREVLLNRWIILSMTWFLAVHSLMIYGEFRGWVITDTLKVTTGLTALLVGGLYVVNFRSPRRAAPYAAIFVAVYFALYGVKVVLSVMQIPTDGIHNLLVVLALLGATFLWLER